MFISGVKVCNVNVACINCGAAFRFDADAYERSDQHCLMCGNHLRIVASTADSKYKEYTDEELDALIAASGDKNNKVYDY